MSERSERAATPSERGERAAALHADLLVALARGGDLDALFAPGVPIPVLERPLVIGAAAHQLGGTVTATFGPSEDLVAGELRLVPSGDRIGALELRRLPVPRVPRDRTSVRALVFAPGPRILLLEYGEPQERLWIAPGGGHEPGEDDPAALRRELAEEVGLRDFVLGPCRFVRTHTFVLGDDVLRQHERYYEVAVPAAFDPAPVAPDADFRGHRWWRVEDLARTDEILVPRRLAALLALPATDLPVDGGI